MADKTGYIGRNPGDSSVKVARQTFTPTTATTDFTFASGYTVGYLDLFLNGAKLIEGTDYNANNGTTISMVADAQSGDVLEAVAYKAFNVGDSSSSSTGNFTVGNDLTVDNNATITNDLNVLGIGTVAKGFNVSAGGANIVGIVSATMGAVVTGVVTATSYKGDGSALTGIAATDTIAAASLTVSGITTLTGAVEIGSGTSIFSPSANNLTFGTNDTEQARIEKHGVLVVGSASTVETSGNWMPGVQINGTGEQASLAAISWGATPEIIFTATEQTTIGSATPNALSDDDLVGRLRWCGDDGVDLNSIGAEILARIDGTPSANNLPTELIFYTNSGASSPTARFILTKDGHLVPNTDSTADIGTSAVRVRNVYADNLYGSAANLTELPSTFTWIEGSLF